jgi:hypothetical protein
MILRLSHTYTYIGRRIKAIDKGFNNSEAFQPRC